MGERERAASGTEAPSRTARSSPPMGLLGSLYLDEIYGRHLSLPISVWFLCKYFLKHSSTHFSHKNHHILIKKKYVYQSYLKIKLQISLKIKLLIPPRLAGRERERGRWFFSVRPHLALYRLLPAPPGVKLWYPMAPSTVSSQGPTLLAEVLWVALLLYSPAASTPGL